MARLCFDLSNTEEMGEFGPLPEGEYQVVITESERADMKSGNGALLKMKMEVVDGKYKGRTLMNFCNLWHNDSVVSEIAKKQLASIIKAVTNNKDTPIADSTELHGVVFTVSVGLQEPDAEGRVFNKIKGFAPRTMGAPAPAHTKEAAQTPRDDTPPERPAWARQG